MRLLSLAAFIVFALLMAWAFHGKARAESRSQQHWGGSDFAFSCATVREWRGAVGRMSAARKADLARQFNITRKQRRQAYACLKGK
jgi:hypothetical protein